VFGEGDGVTTTFRLGRAIGGGVVQIGGVNTVTAVYIDGVPTGAYTISGNQITFSSAPAPAPSSRGVGPTTSACAFATTRSTSATSSSTSGRREDVWLRQVKGGDS
jgi:hypothetical protein